MLSMKALIPMVSDAHVGAWMERRASSTDELSVSLKAAGKVAAMESALDSLRNVVDANADDAVAREKFTRIVENEIRENEELVLSEPHELDKAIYSGAVDGLHHIQSLLSK